MTGMITLYKNLRLKIFFGWYITAGAIPISNEALGEDNVEITALSYGVNLNAEEKEYLKLPNSLTDFVNVDVESIFRLKSR